MQWKPILLHALEWLRHVGEVLAPGAIGAAIAQAWEPGLSLRQRMVQWFVGLAFAAFIVPALGHLFGWGQPIVNAVGFVVGTLAFKAVPALREAFVDGATGALRSIPEIFRSWTRKPGAAAETHGEDA
jgi:hypothetical protein